MCATGHSTHPKGHLLPKRDVNVRRERTTGWDGFRVMCSVSVFLCSQDSVGAWGGGGSVCAALAH